MALRLAVIGDSLAQGFQDGAVGPRHPLWSFPAIIARSLKLGVGPRANDDFRVPFIPGEGLPLDLVLLLERIKRKTGPDIHLLEWPTRVIPAIAAYFEELENFYEVGPGKEPIAGGGMYHNLAAHGLDVFDSINLTSAACDRIIADQEGWFQNDAFGTPSGAKYRAAKMILDPDGKRPHKSQVGNLELLVNGDRGLGLAAEPPDVLILWLGANDCLGTVVELELRDMASDPDPDLSLEGRRAYNLTSEAQFGRDYRALADAIDRILAGHKTQVFVGTVPDVSIPPIAKGLGQVKGGIFPYYVRFFVSGEHERPPPFHRYLTGDEVGVVQRRIAAFNAHIRDIAKGRPHWHVVDVAGVLDQLAVRRKGKDHEAPLREYYEAKGRPEHPLLQLDPIPSLLMLKSEQERRLVGGLTSLDGVHPTTLGYGITAEVFLEAMRAQGIPGADPLAIDWQAVIAKDRIANAAPAVWDDAMAAAAHNSLLWDIAFRGLGSRI
jgi:hypothetical protein